MLAFVCSVHRYAQLYEWANEQGHSVLHAESVRECVEQSTADLGLSRLIWIVEQPDAQEYEAALYLCQNHPELTVWCITDDVDLHLNQELAALGPRVEVYTEVDLIRNERETGDASDARRNRTIPLLEGVFYDQDLCSINNYGVLYPLPERERALLHFLLERRGRFVTTEELVHGLWDEYASPDLLRQYVYRLRRKMQTPVAPNGSLLHCRGAGYLLLPLPDVRSHDMLQLQMRCLKGQSRTNASAAGAVMHASYQLGWRTV